MIKFLCLGSGSSGNCYYLKTDISSILIDAGLGIRILKKSLRNFGISFDSIDAVFITHDHADHIKSVGHLANDHNRPIYATELVHQGINRNYCVTSKLTPENQVVIQKECATQIGDLTITPFEVPHDSTDCVGYLVKQGDVNFCLITDIGEVTPCVQRYISQANYLVLESNHDENMLDMGPYPAYLKGRIKSGKGHLSNRACAEALANYATPGLKHVWLCHLSEENNHPELARKTVDSILREFGIIPGVDFELEILKRRTPSDFYELK